MISDFHVHTNFSKDSTAPVKAQIEQAIKLGMEEICITDHLDYDVAGGKDDYPLDLDAYIPYMEEMKQLYSGRIRVNTGIGLGLQLHIKDYLEGIAADYPWDFVIGSSHFIDNLDPFYPPFYEGRTERQAYERYFEVTLLRAQQLDCYDSFGHLDYVVRYGPNQNRNYNYQSYREYIDPILKAIIDHGKGIECNTGGFKYGLGQTNPCEDILKRYRELGGELLTIGSDSHKTEYLGHHFDQIKSMLQRCGFRYYTVYHNRQPKFIKV